MPPLHSGNKMDQAREEEEDTEMEDAATPGAKPKKQAMPELDVRRSSRQTRPPIRFSMEQFEQVPERDDSPEMDDSLPLGHVFVADIPDVPPKTPTHWVTKDAVTAIPQPILPFTFSNGTKQPGNTFEELWTVQEQDHLISIVQKGLKSTDAGWRGFLWTFAAREFNDYFKGVIHPMGTKLAEPLQVPVIVCLVRDRLFVARTWKDLKDRSVLNWHVIAPDYVKPKLQNKPLAMRPRDDSTSSSLSSIGSSIGGNDTSAIPDPPTALELQWRVDDHDKAPDHQGRMPALPRQPNAGLASTAPGAIKGGPCCLCRKTHSGKWHDHLFMKVPLEKKQAPKKTTVDPEDETDHTLRPENFEVYCDSCYQADYKLRLVHGGPCQNCGATESCEEFHKSFFMEHDKPKLVCSACYMRKFEIGQKVMSAQHKAMHDKWNGKPAPYDQFPMQPRGEPTGFWAGVPQYTAIDVVNSQLSSASRTVSDPEYTCTITDESGMSGLEYGERRQPARAGRDATIDDETVADANNSFTDESHASMQEGSRFSSSPDDESSSPRFARGLPAASSSGQATIPAYVGPPGRPAPRGRGALSIPAFTGLPGRPAPRGRGALSIPAFTGPPATSTPNRGRGSGNTSRDQPADTNAVGAMLFGGFQASREPDSDDDESSSPPVARRRPSAASRGIPTRQRGALSIPAFTGPPPTSTPRGRGALSIPAFTGPPPTSTPGRGREGAYASRDQPADPNAVGAMLFGGFQASYEPDFDSEEEEL